MSFSLLLPHPRPHLGSGRPGALLQAQCVWGTSRDVSSAGSWDAVCAPPGPPWGLPDSAKPPWGRVGGRAAGIGEPRGLAQLPMLGQKNRFCCRKRFLKGGCCWGWGGGDILPGRVGGVKGAGLGALGPARLRSGSPTGGSDRCSRASAKAQRVSGRSEIPGNQRSQQARSLRFP